MAKAISDPNAQKNPKIASFFWPSPPSPKAICVVQSLKNPFPSFRFSLQNSYYIQSSHDSKGGGRRRGLCLLFLRRIKVRKRRRRRKKKGEGSGKICPRWGANWKAAIKETTQTEKKASCGSLTKEKRDGSLSGIGRWCCKSFKPDLKVIDTNDGDSVLFLSNQRFPVVHESKLKVECKNRKGVFRVRWKISEPPVLYSVRGKEKDKVLKRRRGCRVYGAMGGAVYGDYWVLAFQFKHEKEAQKLVQRRFA